MNLAPDASIRATVPVAADAGASAAVVGHVWNVPRHPGHAKKAGFLKKPGFFATAAPVAWEKAAARCRRSTARTGGPGRRRWVRRPAPRWHEECIPNRSDVR